MDFTPRADVNQRSILDRYRSARRNATEAHENAQRAGRLGAPDLSRLRGAQPNAPRLGDRRSDAGPSTRGARTEVPQPRTQVPQRGTDRERLGRRLDRAQRLRAQADRNDSRAKDAIVLGEVADRSTRAVASIGLGWSAGFYYGHNLYHERYNHHSGNSFTFWWFGDYGYPYYLCPPYWGFGFGYYPYWRNSYCRNWWRPYYWCYRDYYSPGLYYGSTIYYRDYGGGGTSYVEYVEPAQEVVVVEQSAQASTPVGEGSIQTQGVERLGADSTSFANNRAASRYLTLGDSAFRDGRYSDAVHFYAKAIEFSSEEGVLYLILADALFATGDYHYCAYALRRALELDPTLLDSVVDKHGFYADGSEFDRQIATLESYLIDHPTDNDARFVLAANYVFGARPAAAVDLLESVEGKHVREEAAGALVLEVARNRQYGTDSAPK